MVAIRKIVTYERFHSKEKVARHIQVREHKMLYTLIN